MSIFAWPRASAFKRQGQVEEYQKLVHLNIKEKSGIKWL
jgi:hypothetical protein